MGNEIAGNAGRPAQPPTRSNDPAGKRPQPPAPAGGSNRNSAPGNPPARTAPAGKPGSPAPDRAAGGKAQEEKKLDGLLPISDQVPTPATPQKKTRKPRQNKKQTNTAFNAEQISALFMSGCAIVASRPGFEMFALTKAEADQLATPIANMIAKSEKFANAGEYADAIALVTAALIIFVPRVLMYADQQKKKKAVKEVPKLVRKESKDSGNGGKDAVRNAHAPADDGASVLSAIPSLC